MTYTKEPVNSKYKKLILTETARKLLLSERYKPLDEKCLGFIKNRNEVIFFDKQLYFDNEELFNSNYETVRFHHQSIDDINELKEQKRVFSKVPLLHPIVLIDDEFVNLRGSRYSTERNYRNRFKKMDIEVCNTYKNKEDVFQLLDYWDKNKRINTKITFTGHDRSFFKRFHNEARENTKLHEYYFYLKDEFLGFIIIEEVQDNFCLAHIRKSKRFDYTSIDFYIDYYAYSDVHSKIGDYSIETGYEVGKLTNYKEEHFNITNVFNSYNVTLR